MSMRLPPEKFADAHANRINRNRRRYADGAGLSTARRVVEVAERVKAGEWTRA